MERMLSRYLSFLRCGFKHHVVGYILEILLFVCGDFGVCLGGNTHSLCFLVFIFCTWARWGSSWLSRGFVPCTYEWTLGEYNIVQIILWCCPCGCHLKIHVVRMVNVTHYRVSSRVSTNVSIFELFPLTCGDGVVVFAKVTTMKCGLEV